VNELPIDGEKEVIVASKTYMTTKEFHHSKGFRREMGL